jgi:hypothetical protein
VSTTSPYVLTSFQNAQGLTLVISVLRALTNKDLPAIQQNLQVTAGDRTSRLLAKGRMLAS